MFTRFVSLCALAGALLSFSLSPTLALSESQQDAAIASLQSSLSSLQSKVTTLQNTVSTQAATITSQQTTINTLKGLTSSFSKVTDTTRADKKKGTELYITGMNLHIVSGSGSTNDGGGVARGLGNVIIGYNGTRTGTGYGADARTGSHNLVLGDLNNYTSFGGIVDGNVNTISGLYASIVGGNGGVASGNFACISGGLYGTASGASSSVGGGLENTASGYVGSVSGGLFNTVSGYVASITGGQSGQAAGAGSSITGGTNNTVGDPANPGTQENPGQPGILASISGGSGLTVTNGYGWAAGSSGSTAYSGNFTSP